MNRRGGCGTRPAREGRAKAAVPPPANSALVSSMSGPSSSGSPSEQLRKPTRVLTGAQLWGNASAIAAHGSWVRGFTNASVIIGVQKSGTTALGTLPAQQHPPLTYSLTSNLLPGALLRIVLGLRGKTHRKELHLFARPRSLAFFHRHILELAEESHGGRWLTDATPNYFQSLTALQQYRVVLPHARLWVILRDPVDRCHQPPCHQPLCHKPLCPPPLRAP